MLSIYSTTILSVNASQAYLFKIRRKNLLSRQKRTKLMHWLFLKQRTNSCECWIPKKAIGSFSLSLWISSRKYRLRRVKRSSTASQYKFSNYAQRQKAWLPKWLNNWAGTQSILGSNAVAKSRSKWGSSWITVTPNSSTTCIGIMIRRCANCVSNCRPATLS